MAITCPNCSVETNKLIAYNAWQPDGYLGCSKCGTPKKQQTLCDLGQTVDKWEATDGSIKRITRGKASEISHRVISKDGNIVSQNGREAQY